ncbi:MAG: MgtC/SapB family protein [Burkholderiaceae bacterium]|nr:MgtC/SapB family protein [Burkholderiaceae bacterium]
MDDLLGGFSQAIAVLASALGCGMLMGIERERRKGRGEDLVPAGVRTFTLTSLAGASMAILGSVPLVAVGAAFVGGLGVMNAARDRSSDPGLTTEMALMLAYVIGVMCAHNQLLAAALAVATTVLLAARDSLHQFSRHWLQPGEVRDGLILAALALLVVPLLPNRTMVWDVLNPQVVVRLLLVLLLVQSLAHVGRRLMQARQAMGLSALASGFVSSTATIATLGMEARQGRGSVRTQAGAAVLSCVGTMVQLLVVAATVQPSWLVRLWWPALAGTVVAAVWGGLLVGRMPSKAPPGHAVEPDSPPAFPPDTAMFRLRDAALVAGLLTTVQIGVHALTVWQGQAGMLAGALLAALADLHSATAAVLMSGGPELPAAPIMAQALMAAVLVHAGSKSVVALVSGGLRYAAYVAPGVFAHSLVFVGCLGLVR